MFSPLSGSFTEMLLTGNCGVPPPEPKAIHCFLQVPEGIMSIAEKLFLSSRSTRKKRFEKSCLMDFSG